jgi:hypothetical protein
MSAEEKISARDAAMRAPFSWYILSKNPALSPAPDSTSVSIPSFWRAGRTVGITATRRSPGKVSFGMPAIISAPTPEG